jgi:hypothetical protein
VATDLVDYPVVVVVRVGQAEVVYLALMVAGQPLPVTQVLLAVITAVVVVVVQHKMAIGVVGLAALLFLSIKDKN